MRAVRKFALLGVAALLAGGASLPAPAQASGSIVEDGAPSQHVYVRSSNGNGYSVCSGTLVTPTKVLSAAHCARSAVELGSGAAAFEVYGTSYHDYKVRSIGWETYPTADILIIDLAEPIPGGQPVQVYGNPLPIGQEVIQCGRNNVVDGTVTDGTLYSCGETSVVQYMAMEDTDYSRIDRNANMFLLEGNLQEALSGFDGYHGPAYELADSYVISQPGDSGGGTFYQNMLVGTTFGGGNVVMLSAYANWLAARGVPIRYENNPGYDPDRLALMPPPQRLAGDDRVGTSIRAFEATAGNGKAVIATGNSAADGLVGAELAGALGTGLLLVTSPNYYGLILQTLLNHGVNEAYVMGGPNAIPAVFDAHLSNSGIKVNRVSGKNRYETAVAAANITRNLTGTVNTVYLADGINFPDALAAGAAAARKGGVVLLTSGPNMVRATQEALSHLPAVRVVAVGGPAVQAAASLGLPEVVQVRGADRYQTAYRLGIVESLGFESVVYAVGSNFADALSAGAVSKRYNATLLLLGKTPDSQIPLFSPDTVDHIWIMGGERVAPIERVYNYYDLAY